MKIAKSTYDFAQRTQTRAILPLTDDEVDGEHLKTSTFKLRTTPTEPNSPKYSLTVPIIDDTVSVRQVLKWVVAVGKVTTGLNITTGTNKNPIIQELCSGSHLVAYNAGVSGNRNARWLALQDQAEQAEAPRNEAAGETQLAYEARITTARTGVGRPDINNADITVGLNNLIAEVCPYKALEKQKRFMRRYMRKPPGMTTRTYAANLLRINQDELVMLPPFTGAAQSLTPDELIDIVTYGIPKSWTRKMDEHDFDPITKGLSELINFCERMEAAEDFEQNANASKQASKPSSKKHKSHRNNPQKGKWCHYHEVDTHDTKDCETLKKLKASKSSKSDSKPPFKNKTWKRKSDDAKSFTKKELAAIGKKAAAKAVKKAKGELHALAKRKSDSSDEDRSASSSSEDENSVHLLEKMDAVDQQLAEFSFDGNKSDGEISC